MLNILEGKEEEEEGHYLLRKRKKMDNPPQEGQSRREGKSYHFHKYHSQKKRGREGDTSSPKRKGNARGTRGKNRPRGAQTYCKKKRKKKHGISMRVRERGSFSQARCLKKKGTVDVERGVTPEKKSGKSSAESKL